jgi:DNA repair photolyase
MTDCHHCSFRSLNRAWGTDLRPADPDQIRKKLENGLKNPKPKSELACALKLQKTIRVGSRSDPYQAAETNHHITRAILKHLIALRWTFVIQTRFLGNMIQDADLLERAHELKLLTVMPVISPGFTRDWEILERKRTTNISRRLLLIKKMIQWGWNVGVNGEPFIPGYHSIKEFVRTIRKLKEVGVKSYNTYNLHGNDYVYKRLHKIGLNIEKIWEMNQHQNWSKIQQILCLNAQKENIILGCPDFVSTGPDWIEPTNTCCGINVPNPSKFNTHWWKRKLQRGHEKDWILKHTWEGIGDPKLAKDIMYGRECKHYTMRDAGMLR